MDDDKMLKYRYEQYLSNVISRTDIIPYTFNQWYASGMPHTGGIMK